MVIIWTPQFDVCVSEIRFDLNMSLTWRSIKAFMEWFELEPINVDQSSLDCNFRVYESDWIVDQDKSTYALITSQTHRG